MSDDTRNALNRADAFNQADSHYRSQIERLEAENAALRQSLERAEAERTTLFTVNRGLNSSRINLINQVENCQQRYDTLRTAAASFVESARYHLSINSNELVFTDEELQALIAAFGEDDKPEAVNNER